MLTDFAYCFEKDEMLTFCNKYILTFFNFFYGCFTYYMLCFNFYFLSTIPTWFVDRNLYRILSHRHFTPTGKSSILNNSVLVMQCDVTFLIYRPPPNFNILRIRKRYGWPNCLRKYIVILRFFCK